MISSDFKNLSPTTSAQQPCRFKPFFPHYRQVVEPFSCNFQKKYDKHIYTLSLKPNNKYFIKRIPMPRTLYSLNIDSWEPGQNLALVKKLVKPYRKYLRNVRGSLKHSKIQKLLPLLATLEVCLRQESMRILFLHRSFKKLVFQFRSSSILKATNPEEFVMRYKARLSRSLRRIKGLKKMIVIIANQKVKPANLMLEIIDESLNLDSLKYYNFIFLNPNPQDIQSIREQKVTANRLLDKVTYLCSNNPACYYSLIYSGRLTSLSSLDLIFDLNKIFWKWEGLFHFHRLPKLQKLHLNFTVYSPTSEMAFFESLSLPPSLEDLRFTLNGFGLSQINEDSQFLKRLQEANRVKAFNLAVVENDANSASHTKFGCLLIQQFKNLETLSFANSGSLLSLRSTNTQTRPLHFENLLMALASSKETLQSLSVKASEVALPEGLYSLEPGFPRLKKLELEDGIPSMTELGRFCNHIPSLNTIALKEIKFNDGEKLEKFLDDVKKIPKGRDFALHFVVENIRQELLIDCLKKYIQEVKVDGRLGMHFRSVEVEDKQAFGEILKLVLQRRCFEPFEMSYLFSVMGKEILKVDKSITLN